MSCEFGGEIAGSGILSLTPTDPYSSYGDRLYLKRWILHYK